MSRFLILAVPLLLSACDVQTRKPAEGDDHVTMSGDATGNVAFNLPFAEGKVKLPAAMMANSNFELDGVKLMPGSQVTGFNVDANKGPTQVRLSFAAPVAPAEARAYFLQQFQSRGVSAAAAGEAITGVSKDGTAFVIRFAPQGNGTAGVIELHPKK